jgi:hypothetical protein
MPVALWIGGSLGSGVISLAVMAGFGALIFVRRPERDDPRPARRRARRALPADRYPRGRDRGDRRITALIVGFLVEVARGHVGSPSSWLGAIAGIAYLIAVVVLRLRG